MSDKVVAVVPARLESQRFPNKLLHEFSGREIISYAVNLGKSLSFVDDVIVATDSEEIVEWCNKNNTQFLYHTDPVRCGSERAKHVFEHHPEYDYYISIPADEVMIDPSEVERAWKQMKTLATPHINNLSNIFSATAYPIITLYSPFLYQRDLESNNTCKLITDSMNRVLYFSRSIIPSTKNSELMSLKFYKKHIGVFVFSYEWMRHMSSVIWDDRDSFLMDIEGLEQNRFLEFGNPVYAVEIEHKGTGADSKDVLPDLEKRLQEK